MTTNKRVLWISRHTFTADQLNDLARVLGTPPENLAVDQYADTVNDMAVLTDHIDQADAVCAVFPPEMLTKLWKICVSQGKKVYTAKNRRERDNDGNFQFIHDGWFEVVRCDFELRRA